MYALMIRKKGKKNWKMMHFRKTVGFARNGAIRTKDDAKFLADVYKNDWIETKVVKL
jgi:hypothetical protein